MIARNFCSWWILAWLETVMWSRDSEGILVSRGWREKTKLTCVGRVRGLGVPWGRVEGSPHPRPVSESRTMALLSGKAHLVGARREDVLLSMVLPAAGGDG